MRIQRDAFFLLKCMPECLKCSLIFTFTSYPVNICIMSCKEIEIYSDVYVYVNIMGSLVELFEDINLFEWILLI